ncbi:MAG: S-methyl-5-thioribose-1-phosphate isomerase [Dehalococcoidia bacterium]|nr:S-methyl-5-thioribose-1-phosphate isomerase [Dehalococcoidia bacterium]
MSNARSPQAPYEVIRWSEEGLSLLDQTRLPWSVEHIAVRDLASACEAITTMRVRGAPAIGITAAYALAQEARRLSSQSVDDARQGLAQAAERLAATRPTAVNLRWAVARVLAATEHASDSAVLAHLATEAAQEMHAEQIEADRRMAALGAPLLEDGAQTVITHCNTGPLATGGLGTALGVIIEGHRQGRVRDVLVDETRPRWQGARLTSWELQQHGVPHDVIADGAAAGLITPRGVRAAFVGADRIAANGDTANKVGTFGLALACRYHGVPFYVVAPRSTVDLATPSGRAIVIEERDEDEVLSAGGTRLAAPGAHAVNPAFDVTPAELITAIVTEAGVLRPPYAPALREAITGRSG